VDTEILKQIAARVAADEEEGESVTPAETEELNIDPRWPPIKTLVQSELYPLFKQLKVVVKNEDETALANIYKEILAQLAKLAFLMGMTSVKTQIQTLKSKIFD